MKGTRFWTDKDGNKELEYQGYKDLALAIIFQAVSELHGPGRRYLTPSLIQPKDVIMYWMETKAYKYAQLANLDIPYEEWLKWVNKGCPGINNMDRKEKLSNIDRHSIYLMWQKGFSQREIADTYHVSITTVRRAIDEGKAT